MGEERGQGRYAKLLRKQNQIRKIGLHGSHYALPAIQSGHRHNLGE